jgi:hypothetical protein
MPPSDSCRRLRGQARARQTPPIRGYSRASWKSPQFADRWEDSNLFNGPKARHQPCSGPRLNLCKTSCMLMVKDVLICSHAEITESLVIAIGLALRAPFAIEMRVWASCRGLRCRLHRRRN